MKYLNGRTMSQLIRIILIVLVLVAAVLVWMELREDGSRRLQPASDEEQAEEIPIRFAP